MKRSASPERRGEGEITMLSRRVQTCKGRWQAARRRRAWPQTNRARRSAGQQLQPAVHRAGPGTLRNPHGSHGGSARAVTSRCKFKWLRGRVAVIGDRCLGGRRMMDQTHRLPGTLAEFLEERLPLFHDEPPDEDWVYGLAQVYTTTPETVWRAVRQRMPAAPTEPPAAVWVRPPDAPIPGPPVERLPERLRPRGFDEVVARFRQHGHQLKTSRGGFITRCPLHRDCRPASLQISCSRRDGRTALVFCHSCRKGKD